MVTLGVRKVKEWIWIERMIYNNKKCDLHAFYLWVHLILRFYFYVKPGGLDRIGLNNKLPLSSICVLLVAESIQNLKTRMETWTWELTLHQPQLRCKSNEFWEPFIFVWQCDSKLLISIFSSADGLSNSHLNRHCSPFDVVRACAVRVAFSVVRNRVF